MKAYFAGVEESKHQAQIEYWSITFSGVSSVKKQSEFPVFDNTEEKYINFSYKDRTYKIEKPLNVGPGDTLIFRSPINPINKIIPRSHIKEISNFQSI